MFHVSRLILILCVIVSSPVSKGFVPVSLIYSLVADSCGLADALATAFFVMGPEAIETFVSKNNLRLKIFVIMKDGKIRRFAAPRTN